VDDELPRPRPAIEVSVRDREQPQIRQPYRAAALPSAHLAKLRANVGRQRRDRGLKRRRRRQRYRCRDALPRASADQGLPSSLATTGDRRARDVEVDAVDVAHGDVTSAVADDVAVSVRGEDDVHPQDRDAREARGGAEDGAVDGARDRATLVAARQRQREPEHAPAAAGRVGLHRQPRPAGVFGGPGRVAARHAGALGRGHRNALVGAERDDRRALVQARGLLRRQQCPLNCRCVPGARQRSLARAADAGADAHVADDRRVVAELVGEKAVDALHRRVSGREHGRRLFGGGAALAADPDERAGDAAVADAQLHDPVPASTSAEVAAGDRDRRAERDPVAAARPSRRRHAQLGSDGADAPAIDDTHPHEAARRDAARCGEAEAACARRRADAVGRERE